MVDGNGTLYHSSFFTLKYNTFAVVSGDNSVDDDSAYDGV